jgi:DNA-binding NtrC family response regulator
MRRVETPTRGLTRVDLPSIRTLRAEVIDGPDAGKSASHPERISIGTAPSNDVVLSDDTVSRFHLDLLRRTDAIAVVDHESTNGTVADRLRIRSAEVPSGTILAIGRTKIRVSDGELVAVDPYDGDGSGELVGRSSAMRRAIAQIERAGRSDVSVLILGETGTGKEVAARALHDLGSRSGQPFEAVDCGSILPTLVASELFGHEQGAFTGADRRHVGAFERAHGGTLFLDEIGELPGALQATLLGALERRSFRRVGGSERIDVDVRLVAATNRDLRAEVNSGRFRPDLYYRIAVVTLDLPPLRERSDDIPLLAAHFLRKAGFTGPIEAILPARALDRMKEAHWPGNVRELKNFVEAALVMGVADAPPSEAAPPQRDGDLPSLDHLLDMGFNEARARLIDAFEVAYVEKGLARAGGNVSLAARSAKLHRSYLNRLLSRHGIRVDRVAQKRSDE